LGRTCVLYAVNDVAGHDVDGLPGIGENLFQRL